MLGDRRSSGAISRCFSRKHGRTVVHCDHRSIREEAEVVERANDPWHVARLDRIAAGAVPDRVDLQAFVEDEAPPSRLHRILAAPGTALAEYVHSTVYRR